MAQKLFYDVRHSGESQLPAEQEPHDHAALAGGTAGAFIPRCFASYGLRPITAPFAAGASNQIVSICRNPASSSHAEYSAGV